MDGTPQFIPKAGACLLSKNVIEGRGRVRWMLRTTSKVPEDNGWRIFSHIDDAAYLSDPNNLQVVDFNQACLFEPALIGIWNFPVGSDLQIVDEGNGIQIVETKTGRVVPRDEFYIPASLPPLGSPVYPGYQWLYKQDYARLVKELVPARGPASTLQGELIRAVDKLWFEAQDNGNVNWGPDFDLFVDLLDLHLVGGAAGAEQPPRRPQWLGDDDFAKACQDLRIVRHCGHVAYRYKPQFARKEGYEEYSRANPKVPDGPGELPDLAYPHNDLYQHLMDCVIIWARQQPSLIPYVAPPGFGH